MTVTINEPVPIHLVAGKYLIHDADTAAYLRRTHNITGVLIGGLPQAPQQNVFSGLPVELMPEEARLLVEKKVGYIIDDASQHVNGFLTNGISVEEQAKLEALLSQQSTDAAEAQFRRATERKDNALRKLEAEGKKVGNGDMNNWNDMPDDMLAPRPRGTARPKSRRRGAERSVSGNVTPLSAAPSAPPSLPPSGPPSRSRTPVRSSAEDSTAESQADERQDLKAQTSDEAIFETSAPVSRVSTIVKPSLAITPATSYPPLRPREPDTPLPLPEVPSSYPIFAHLHSKGYFMSPGLRFGCRYVAYPGDSLRYHSHFLVEGKDWDEEFSLMDLVSGGRLGTGVKKGYLIGGKGDDDNVRAFTVEWAGM